jgi:hypothetical protein
MNQDMTRTLMTLRHVQAFMKEVVEGSPFFANTAVTRRRLDKVVATLPPQQRSAHSSARPASS